MPGTGGERFVPYGERTGNESIVYFTRDLSAAGLRKAYAKVNGTIGGRVGIKLHTGEKNGPNIIPRAWVRELVEQDLPGAHIIETNTYYEGDRYTTDQHRETLAVNGWDFCPVDIIDDMGEGLLDYDSMVTLTHFKGHMMGGFGGSNKNIGIGCADGRIGKKAIHSYPDGGQWSIATEELMERISESTKATIDHFGKRVCYVNVMRNMSVSCDCEGTSAAPVVTPNVGILASMDIVAIDQACVDIVYAMREDEHHDLVERIETRHGLRQLSYMHELGMGNVRYVLVDLDNGEARMDVADAVRDLEPFSG